MEASSKFIRETRKKLKISQEQFGEKIGYSRSYVRDVESGKVQPSRSFLEKMSVEFNVSVDSLLDIDPILKIVDQNRGHENPNIPFLIGFTQDEIDKIENYLRELFKERNSIFVDASKYKSATQLYQAIAEKKGKIHELVNVVESILLDNKNAIMLVIKNVSKSKIGHKGGHIRDIFKMMDDAWIPDENKKNVIHVNPKSCLILIDFPSFLERYYENIGYYTIPYYPPFLKWYGF